MTVLLSEEGAVQFHHGYVMMKDYPFGQDGMAVFEYEQTVCRAEIQPWILRQWHLRIHDVGEVVFAERVRMASREMARAEVDPEFVPYQRTAAICHPEYHPYIEYHPVYGYLAPKAWLQVLQVAGFSRAEVCPDVNALAPSFPNQYAAVIVADK